MPIKTMIMTPVPGQIVQLCANCGAEHTISLDRGAQKARTGPVALQVGDTLELRIDAAAAVTVTFRAGDVPDFACVTAGQLVAKLNAELPGVHARDDAGGLLIESATTGPDSCLEITGGTARAALGFATDGPIAPCLSRPVLGISLGPGQPQDPNVIALRRCSDCGANECLVRTFDAAPPELEGTHFQQHRRAVNALAELCKAHGWSHPDLATHHAAETARPRDLANGQLHGSLVLPRFQRPGAPTVEGADTTNGAAR